ncbi:hypothetical protein FX016_23140 [Cupriavidus gilardii]|nr:hypothetical protein FX016_23140 [Cupriavidus gilardii]
MASAFDSPDVVELKGRLTGVTRLSRKVRILVLFAVFALVAFVLFSITSMDSEPSTTADPAAAGNDAAAADKRPVEPAKPNFAGIGDGQASLAVSELDVPSGNPALQPTFPVGAASAPASSAGASSTISKGNAGVPALPGGDAANALPDSHQQYQSPEQAAAARAQAERDEVLKRSREANLEMEGGGDLARLPASGQVGVPGAGGTANPLAALAAAAQAAQAANAGQGGMSGGMPIVPAIGQQDDQNKQLRKEQFLRSGEAAQKTYLNERVQVAASPFEIKAGWAIPSALECGVNSDLPGQTCARVIQNVYDTATGRHLLIPQGTKLIGSYDSQIAYGQKRILAVWNRLIFPDGSSISLNGMPGTDRGGYAGFDADVDNHYGRIFGGALLMATFSAGISMTQKQTTNPNGSLTNSQVVTQEVGRQLGQTGAAFIQRGMNIQPTLSRDPGYKFNVITTRDIVFPGAYKPQLAEAS